MIKEFGLELTEAEHERAARIRKEFVYWNLCDSTTRECGDEIYLDQVKASNVTAINHTVCYSVDFAEGVKNIAHWTRLYDTHPEVGFIAKSYADIARAQQEQRTAIFMGFQDVTALEDDMDKMKVFYDLGIRFVQPTYQDRNLFGDGCGERYQSGLSNLGIKFIKKLDELGIVIDTSHVGIGTTIDCATISERPIMATHTAARGIVDTPRNKTDDEIKAIAAKGGVIGIAGKSGFLKKDGLDTGSTINDMIDHVVYIANLVGIEHVGIGTDVGDLRKYSPDRMAEFHARHPEVAIIGPKLRTDIMHPKDVGPGTLHYIIAYLAKREFSDDEIRMVLGENANRVVKAVFKD
ncbi:dipeptidase [Bordetella sp. BOR01]|uniref:dipeptidase n=1 Tax=Bordetella sp. BOR01 TaxID=2854779 RepID=UPI001C46DC28|nr:membrane dipeptidase [Bordetella sp. BOR01]MBV7482961.1 dipeptidase [Bordetella sp. BOR01]